VKGGFNQFEIYPGDREYTTFTWKGKQYRFRGAPFGFKHLPAMFQKVMSGLFEVLSFVLVNIDDIVIFSIDYREHIQHVQVALDRLNQANLKANQKKCYFARTKILILGYMLSAEGIQVCTEKLLQLQQ
jgi:ribosome-interacting GTPase 1